MGRDKTYLPVEWKGVSMPLWERQLAVLRSVGPTEVVISGPRKRGYPESAVVLPDLWNEVGPLGGIATCLDRTGTDLLLVLAIDLPLVQPGFLKKLLGLAQAGCGVVPKHHGHFEPLMAVYPGAARELAIGQISARDYVLQRFIHRLLEQRLMTAYELERGEGKQMENWNHPADLG